MKKLLLIASFFALASFATPIDDCCSKKAKKCSGDSYCTACKNCSGCKHCKSGGTCGVCEKPKTKKKSKG